MKSLTSNLPKKRIFSFVLSGTTSVSFADWFIIQHKLWQFVSFQSFYIFIDFLVNHVIRYNVKYFTYSLSVFLR
jgi:hypothetical protein